MFFIQAFTQSSIQAFICKYTALFIILEILARGMCNILCWTALLDIMKWLSHIMVSLSVLLLLLFGAGGMGWQRCSCSGRVSLLSLADGSCCPRGGSCMVVTVSPISAADFSQPTPHVDATVMDVAVVSSIWPSVQLLPSERVSTPVQCECNRSGPPGWLTDNCPVMRN